MSGHINDIYARMYHDAAQQRGTYPGQPQQSQIDTAQQQLKIALRDSKFPIAKGILSRYPSLINSELFDDKATPLLYASNKPNVPIDFISFLLDNGANINAKNVVGDTPLLRATIQGNLPVVELLLTNNADANVICRRTDPNTGRASEEGLLAIASKKERDDIYNAIDPYIPKEPSRERLAGGKRKTIKRKIVKRKVNKHKSVKRKTIKRKVVKRKKIHGGYSIEKQQEQWGQWDKVVYTTEEQDAIRNYLVTHPQASSVDIRDALFPDIPDKLKPNAAWEIQVILARAYSGN
jgi:hypothetical protein